MNDKQHKDGEQLRGTPSEGRRASGFRKYRCGDAVGEASLGNSGNVAPFDCGKKLIQGLVDKSRRLPLYLQLAESLERRIKDGDLAPGDSLPPENELSKQLGVSPVTVKNGLKILVDKGLIRRISGRGTFVSAPSEAPPIRTLEEPATVTLREGMYGVISYPSGQGWNGQVIAGLEKILKMNRSRLRFIPYVGQAGPRLPRHDWGRIYGVAVIAAGETDVSDTVDEAEKLSVPVVIVSDFAPPVPANCIECDQEQAGREAARHLVECGYTHFIHLSSGTERLRHARQEGFVRELRLHGIPESSLSVITEPAGESCANFGRKTADDLPLVKERIGVFAGDDETAGAFATRTAERGKNAGEDYGLVGCGDAPQFRHLGITTLAFPWEKAGEIAGKRLMGLLDDAKGTLRFMLWPVLIERGSTAAS